MSRFRSHLIKMEQQAACRPDPAAGWDIILAYYPVASAPEGRPPGFYPPDSPLGTAADLVFAGDQPVIPERVMAPNCLVVVSNPG